MPGEGIGHRLFLLRKNPRDPASLGAVRFALPLRSPRTFAPAFDSLYTAILIKTTPVVVFIKIVPGEGIEPSCMKPPILSRLRIPVPPPGHEIAVLHLISKIQDRNHSIIYSTIIRVFNQKMKINVGGVGRDRTGA